MSAKRPASQNLEPNAQQVRDYLLAHPEFLTANMDVFAGNDMPARELGGGVADFQQHMLKHLQQDTKTLKSRYDVLVDFCRDNMSVQTQVHHAALRLIRARNIEQLLEVITMDLVSLFDVDVVRLAMESDIQMDTSFGEHSYSGIVFVEQGLTDKALGKKRNVLLVEECDKTPPYGFEQIFADCESMIASCALLRLDLQTVDRNIILAFGVRYASRFHAGQGIELLHFLAQIVAHQLDTYLTDMAA